MKLIAENYITVSFSKLVAATFEILCFERISYLGLGRTRNFVSFHILMQMPAQKNQFTNSVRKMKMWEWFLSEQAFFLPRLWYALFQTDIPNHLRKAWNCSVSYESMNVFCCNPSFWKLSSKNSLITYVVFIPFFAPKQKTTKVLGLTVWKFTHIQTRG